MKNIQSNVSTVPVDPPPAEPTFTPSTGKYAWGPNGEVPKEMQDWSATDVSDYITATTKLYQEGKVGPGAVSKAVALKKFHAAKYVAFQNQKVTDWRKESPDFDDPSSPNYRMLFGRTKVKLGIDSQTGLEAWQRA